MVGCLAFWLGAVWIADRHPYVRHPQITDMPGPVLGGTHLAEGGRSVSPDRDAPAFFTDAEVTELTSPVVGGPEQPGRPQVPDQRGTEALPTSAQEVRPQLPVAPSAGDADDAGAAGRGR